MRSKAQKLLNSAFQALANDPNLGKSADDVREGYFRHHVGSHVLFFKRRKTGVEIVRILHEKMAPARHL
jgi:toxin ParE1/3/4